MRQMEIVKQRSHGDFDRNDPKSINKSVKFGKEDRKSVSVVKLKVPGKHSPQLHSMSMSSQLQELQEIDSDNDPSSPPMPNSGNFARVASFSNTNPNNPMINNSVQSPFTDNNQHNHNQMLDIIKVGSPSSPTNENISMSANANIPKSRHQKTNTATLMQYKARNMGNNDSSDDDDLEMKDIHITINMNDYTEANIESSEAKTSTNSTALTGSSGHPPQPPNAGSPNQLPWDIQGVLTAPSHPHHQRRDSSQPGPAFYSHQQQRQHQQQMGASPPGHRRRESIGFPYPNQMHQVQMSQNFNPAQPSPPPIGPGNHHKQYYQHMPMNMGMMHHHHHAPPQAYPVGGLAPHDPHAMRKDSADTAVSELTSVTASTKSMKAVGAVAKLSVGNSSNLIPKGSINLSSEAGTHDTHDTNKTNTRKTSNNMNMDPGDDGSSSEGVDAKDGDTKSDEDDMDQAPGADNEQNEDEKARDNSNEHSDNSDDSQDSDGYSTSSSSESTTDSREPTQDGKEYKETEIIGNTDNYDAMGMDTDMNYGNQMNQMQNMNMNMNMQNGPKLPVVFSNDSKQMQYNQMMVNNNNRNITQLHYAMNYLNHDNKGLLRDYPSNDQSVFTENANGNNLGYEMSSVSNRHLMMKQRPQSGKTFSVKGNDLEPSGIVGGVLGGMFGFDNGINTEVLDENTVITETELE